MRNFLAFIAFVAVIAGGVPLVMGPLGGDSGGAGLGLFFVILAAWFAAETVSGD